MVAGSGRLPPCGKRSSPNGQQAPTIAGLFDPCRTIELDDGRTLVVMYQGERYGWGAYVPAENRRPASAASPVEAIAGYLELSRDRVPAGVERLSREFQNDLSEAPRYACDCCGYLTLLNPGHYEICAVCGWEDDRCDNNRICGGPDAPSGPNHVSLTQGRGDFALFGASKERSKEYVRGPRPEEYPPD